MLRSLLIFWGTEPGARVEKAAGRDDACLRGILAKGHSNAARFISIISSMLVRKRNGVTETSDV
jgi:hypothetical protein